MGVNYEQIPVNKCPYATNNYQRDGLMQVGDNGGAAANYRPNSFDNIVADVNYKEPEMKLDTDIADWYDRNENDDDHYTQPGNLYRMVMNEAQKAELAENIIGSMLGIAGEKKEEIIKRQLCHFFRMDATLGMVIAKGLNINIDEKFMDNHSLFANTSGLL